MKETNWFSYLWAAFVLTLGFLILTGSKAAMNLVLASMLLSGLGLLVWWCIVLTVNLAASLTRRLGGIK